MMINEAKISVVLAHSQTPIHIIFAAETLEKQILTSIWSAQHPNAGQNIQRTAFFKH